METTLGLIAAGMTVAYASIGIAGQVRTNYLNRSTSGLSLFMITMSWVTFLVWLAYGWFRSEPDWFIVAANGAGAFFTGLILIQFRLYRSAKGHSDDA